MTMPNFLIIGAAKSGTSSVYNYLRQHPQVFVSPVKEPQFFAYEGESLDFKGPGDEKLNRGAITQWAGYHSLFQAHSNELAVGEASTAYLYSPKAPDRIRYHIPNVKLIAILRNPVDRAYSNFSMLVRDRHETCYDFSAALAQEERRIREHWAPRWYYKQLGFYSVQLARYFDRFSREQIKVYLYDDFARNPLGVVQDLFRFLEVDDTFVPDMSRRYNVSGIPKSRTMYALIEGPDPIKMLLRRVVPGTLRRRTAAKLQERNLRRPPPLAPSLRQELLDLYRDDILRLETLIQQDLSIWLQPDPVA